MSQYTLQYSGVLSAHTGWVTAIDSIKSQDGDEKIISGSRDKSLIVWRMGNDSYAESEGTPLHRLTGHQNSVTSVSVNESGSCVASSSEDGTVKIWDLETQTCVNTFNFESPNKSRDPKNLRKGPKAINCVSFVPLTDDFMSCGDDRILRVTDMGAKATQCFETGNHSDGITSALVFLCDDQPRVVSASRDNTLRFWNYVQGKVTNVMTEHTAAINAVAAAPDGTLCATGSSDNTVGIWNVEKCELEQSFATDSVVNDVCFSPFQYWVTAATDKNVLIWDLDSKELLHELAPAKERFSLLPWAISLKWIKEGNTLLVGCSDNNVHVYNMIG